MSNNYQKFLATYVGRELLRKHLLTETGLWHILGEDPNCELSGPHINPDLGVAEGRLQDVIEYAVELPGFWQWGRGGDITKVKSIKIDPNSLKRITALRENRDVHRKQIELIDKELRELGVE